MVIGDWELGTGDWVIDGVGGMVGRLASGVLEYPCSRDFVVASVASAGLLTGGSGYQHDGLVEQ